MESRKINTALDSLITTAVETSAAENVASLLEQGANPDAIVSTFKRNQEFHALDEEEKHLLHLAVELDSIEILQLLLKHGANPALKNSAGLTAVELAICKHNILAICTFAQFVPLHPRILGDALWHLLAHHSEGCLPIVKTLLEQGADPTISQDFSAMRESKKERLSSLSLSARYCVQEVTTLLLQYGASLKDLCIKNEKKQRAFDTLYIAVTAAPHFESDKQLHHAERDAKAIKAEALEREHLQRQEARRLADVQNQVDAFKKIYTALRDGQSGWVKTNFLNNLRLLSPDAQLAEIQKHAAEKQDSRTAKAWELAKTHYADCNNRNLELFASIYDWSFSKSGLFKQSRVTGITLFKHSEAIKFSLGPMSEQQLNHFTLNNADSRTAKILRVLS